MIGENCNAKWLKGAPYLYPEGSEGSLFNKEGLRLLIPYEMKAELLDPRGGNYCNVLGVLKLLSGEHICMFSPRCISFKRIHWFFRLSDGLKKKKSDGVFLNLVFSFCSSLSGTKLFCFCRNNPKNWIWECDLDM